MIRRVFRSIDPDAVAYSGEDAPEASDLSYADLISSEIDEYRRPYDEHPYLFERVEEHAPVLDIDFPAAVVPSSTPGHFHLYLDTRVPHDKYMALLDALAEAGIIQEGYASASKSRGYTAVRLPWVEKPNPNDAEIIEHLEQPGQGA